MTSGGQRISIILSALAAISPLAAAAPTASSTDHALVEARVLAALNDARADPQAYVNNLKAYRKQFNGKVVTLSGTRVTYLTREGIAPIDEAVVALSMEERQAGLKAAPILAAAAADHVSEQSASGHIGHYSQNGFGPGQRASRRGGGRMVTEVITYGAFNPADVVRQLIVDDGVPDRGHRTAVFASHLRYAGVACGPHPVYRTICVIDMAETPDGRVLPVPGLRA